MLVQGKITFYVSKEIEVNTYDEAITKAYQLLDGLSIDMYELTVNTLDGDVDVDVEHAEVEWIYKE